MSELNYDYKPLPPFKWFVLENFPFIEADFDALTNWQLFCKLGKEMNKLIEDMNLTGEQVEALTNAFNQLETYVNETLSDLNLQDEVNQKLDEMVEDGTLANIINEELLGEINNTISKVQTASFETPVMPPVRNLGKNSPKFVNFNASTNELQVVQKNSNGYLIYTLNTANGDSSSASVGTNWDLIRLKKIQFSQFAYCFKDTFAETVGTLSTLQQPSGSNSFVEQNINKATLPYTADCVYKNKESLAIYGLTTSNNSTPSQVKYSLKYNTSGKANILFYCSALSSTDVDIILNGETIGNLNLANFAKNNVGCFYVYEFNIPQLQGTATNKIQEVIIKNNDLSHTMYFCCMNYLRLEDYDGRDIDSFKATGSGCYYVNSDGASDYAIYDSDLQKFMGSYHGGETAIQQKFTQPNLSSYAVDYNVDFFDSGIYINNNLPASNTWFIIPSFELLQVTNLNDKGTMISILDFNNDGCLDMNFKFKGDVNTTKFFTGLTCNSTLMNVIKYPNNAGISSGDNMVDLNNGLVNFTSSTKFLQMDINYTKFPNTYIQSGYENGYVNSTSGYNKFYSYAIFNPSTPVNVKELMFRKVLNCFYR